MGPTAEGARLKMLDLFHIKYPSHSEPFRKELYFHKVYGIVTVNNLTKNIILTRTPLMGE